MSDKIDPTRRDSQSNLGPKESDRDCLFPDRRTLDEKMDEVIAEAVVEIRRAFRGELESKD